MAQPARDHTHPFVPYRPARLPVAEALRRGRELHRHLDTRRSVRWFSPDPVPLEAIEIAVAVANTAPSGAHQQPWTFVATRDAGLRRRVREAAEAEERRFYRERDIPGLATLTHTPNPMSFLTEIFGRPATERPFILFPVGYPADDCEVPDLRRKPLPKALVVV